MKFQEAKKATHRLEATFPPPSLSTVLSNLTGRQREKLKQLADSNDPNVFTVPHSLNILHNGAILFHDRQLTLILHSAMKCLVGYLFGFTTNPFTQILFHVIAATGWGKTEEGVFSFLHFERLPPQKCPAKSKSFPTSKTFLEIRISHSSLFDNCKHSNVCVIS